MFKKQVWKKHASCKKMTKGIVFGMVVAGSVLVCETPSVPVFAEETVSAYSSLELYTLLAENEMIPYEINEKASDFLENHEDLFPVKGDTVIPEELLDSTIEYKHVAKNESKYGDKLMSLPRNYVVQIDEAEIDTGDYLTELNLIDENEQQYWVFYHGELPDIFEENVVSVTGLPLGCSSFENTDGGNTLVLVLAGSQVTLLE